MKEIALQTHADGCILWRQRVSNPDQLSLMGGWFGTPKGYPIALSRVDREYEVKVDGRKEKVGTYAFQAIDKNEPRIENDLNYYFKGQRRQFFDENHIQKMLCAPIEFGVALKPERNVSEAQRWKGVLCLYRTDENNDFTLDEAKSLQAILPALARIYRAAIDAIKLALIENTDAILQEAPSEGGEDELKEVIKTYASAVASSFGAVECAVFLEVERGEYKCCYTTEEDDTIHAERTSEAIYRVRHGFSGLALAVNECIRVRDLADPAQDIKELKEKHGATCFAVEPKPQDDKAKTPPSLIVTRLEYRGKVVGFIRCWRPRSGSCYYLQEDAELLELVAKPLARYIVRFKEEDEREQGIKLFDKLAVGKGKNPRKSSQIDAFTVGIEQAAEIFPMAKIITVRLADFEKKQLRIHGYGIHPSIVLDKAVREAADLKSWPLDRIEPVSYAARVMRSENGEGFWIKDTSDRQKFNLYTELYPDVRQVITVLIAAEVEGELERYGVLDLRTVNADEFSEHHFRVAKALGLRIGSQHHAEKLRKAGALAREAEREAKLSAQIASLNASQRELETQRRTQMAFQDLSHQLKGPLHDLRRTLEGLQMTPGRGISEGIVADLLSRSRRAELFAKLVGLLGNLVQNENATLSPEKSMGPREWQQVIGPLCVDMRLRIQPRRNIRVEFDADSLDRHAPVNLNADMDLMTHCIMNLLDNAVKYSRPNTVIRVFAGHSSNSQRFYVAVTNCGIPILPGEVHLCKQRGWRKPEAIRCTGEGAGIGLYVVDQIMRLHQGAVNVLPTRIGDGITEIRLNFPPNDQVKPIKGQRT